MKKILLTLVLGLSLLLPFQVQAIDLGGQLVNDTAAKAGYDKNTNEQSVAELIGTVIKAVLSFVGVIFLVLMVYAGYLWMTARGEEGQIEKAQDIIKSSVIGLVIMVGAYSITSFVVPRIVEKSTGDTSGGGGGGNDSVLCCVVCPAHGGGDCKKSIVSAEGECMQKLGCPDNSDNNVENDCSVTPTPANQCAGAINRVNCCTVTTDHGVTTKRIVANEDDCDSPCDFANGNNNVGGWECDYEEEVDVNSCR